MESKTILLVDDVYYNRILIESLLQDWGYGVALANNGAEALSYLEQNTPDLIILDLMMPVMDGFTFLERISELKKDVPIIVLSARNDMISIQRALKLGAFDYITKPFNSHDIKNKISLFFSTNS